MAKELGLSICISKYFIKMYLRPIKITDAERSDKEDHMNWNLIFTKS